MGNFFIFKAHAPKMFTDNPAELHYVHSGNSELPSELLFCLHHCFVFFYFFFFMCLDQQGILFDVKTV